MFYYKIGMFVHNVTSSNMFKILFVLADKIGHSFGICFHLAD